MLRSLFFSFFLLMAFVAIAQDYVKFQTTLKRLSNSDPGKVQILWDSLVRTGRIPLVEQDSVAFLYKGNVTSVKWTGDFNGWEYDRSYNNKGSRIGGSDVWILKASFPRDARLDYKLIVDDQWILDPENSNHQLSGVGGGSPNSELRMPEWKPDPNSLHDASIPAGTLKENLLFTSKKLGYQLTYSLYVPHGQSEPASNIPILYVTDGYEYLHPQMGAMKTVLDNLIGKKLINPVVVVFVDNRDPLNRSNNRRMQELAMSAAYLDFFVNELIPKVEKDLSITATAAERGVLGTSMGGLTSAFFAFSRPDIFGLAGIQSPAFWFRPEIYTLCTNAESPPQKIYLTTGTFFDAHEGVEKMKTILEKNTCTFQFKEVNQGHSWGQWKDLIDDILIYFYARK
jgi:enterochelin esterase-like enzyme